jgi:quercetin dioxygenase-like cupin family protein
MKSRNSRISAALAAAAIVLVGIPMINAQPAPAAKRTVLMKQDMTIPGREALMVLTEIPLGGAEGRHTHPAEVYAFVLDGNLVLEREGMPTATVKAGDHFYIAPGQIHQGINKGTVPVKLAVVFVAEKGKPLTTQVP